MSKWEIFSLTIVVLLILIIGLGFYLVKTKKENLDITQQFEENHLELEKTKRCNYNGLTYKVDEIFSLNKYSRCSECRCLSDGSAICVIISCSESELNE